jgi:hypothetical protein
MILDERTEFADATSIINATGLLLIGDVIDLSVARNVGSPPRPLYLVIQVATTVLAAGGASEVQFTLASDAQAAIAVDGTATVHWRSAAIAKATLVAGYTLCIPLPGVKPDYERYLGLLVGITTFAVTAGAINAFLTHDPKQWKAYADGLV